MADSEIPETGSRGSCDQEQVAMDKLTPDRRSRNMRQIRGKNTVPELRVRRLCREIGFSGYRIHRKDLPGKPDLAWIGRKLAIFVHGCFWHGHDNCAYFKLPKTRTKWWRDKIERNKLNDSLKQGKLAQINFRIIIIWECQIKNKEIFRTLIKDVKIKEK